MLCIKKFCHDFNILHDILRAVLYSIVYYR